MLSESVKTLWPIAVFLLLAIFICAVKGAEKDYQRHEISDATLEIAIWIAESDGSLFPKDGDDGKAIGPLQIWWVYWHDAVQHSQRNHDKWQIADGHYDDCRKLEYAVRCMRAYMDRYARGRPWYQKAMVHNGGPYGWLKPSANRYLKDRVIPALETMPARR